MANTLAGVAMGVSQVQGTINGFGERCGNSNLISIIPNLQLKMGKNCVKPAQLKKLREVSHFFYELANSSPTNASLMSATAPLRTKAGSTCPGC